MSSKEGLRFRLPTDCIPQLRNALARYLSFLPLSTAFQIRPLAAAITWSPFLMTVQVLWPICAPLTFTSESLNPG